MPFKGALVARALHLLGAAGSKIIATIENGQPRIDFYTGDANEAAPASIFTVVNTPVPGQFAIVMQGPDPSGSQDPAQLLLGSVDTQLINYNQGGIIGLIHDFSGNSIEIGPFDFGGISYESNAGHQFDGKINMQDGIQGTGRTIVGFDCGSVSANTFGGNGLLNYSHNLGGPASDTFFAPIRSAAGSSYLTREPAGDTANTFQCQATLNAGGNPPNGTNIPCTYIGFKVA